MLKLKTYDSTLEKIFSSLSLGSWKIKREPTILKAGKYAFVPDFVPAEGRHEGVPGNCGLLDSGIP